MSEPRAPTALGAVAAIFRLSLLRLSRGKKLRVAAIAVVSIVAATVLTRYAAQAADPSAVMKESIQLAFFSLLVFLVPFLVSSGAIGEEVEARTLVYLTSRPSGRLAIPLGKYLAALACTLPLLAGGLLLLHVGVFATTPSALVEALPSTLQTAGAVCLLGAYYCGICLFWSALVPEAAGILATLHLAIVEWALRLAPGVFRYVSMNYWAGKLAGLPDGGLRPDLVADTPAYPGAIALVTLTLLFIGGAALAVRTSEFRHGSG